MFDPTSGDHATVHDIKYVISKELPALTFTKSNHAIDGAEKEMPTMWSCNCHPGQSTMGYINSYATYAFPHSTNRTSIYYPMSQEQQNENDNQKSASMASVDKEDAHSAKFPPSTNNSDSSEVMS